MMFLLIQVVIVVASAQTADRPAVCGEIDQPAAKQLPTESKRPVVQARRHPADLTNPGPQPADSAIIKFDEPIYNFGRVMAGKPVRHDFRFTNTGNQLLVINGVKPSCGCATAGPYDEKIPPKEFGKIPISMNTRSLHGEIRKSVTVTTNDPGRPTVRLQLTGEVVPLVQVTPPSALFGQLKDDVKQTRVLKIVNNLDQPLELSSIEYDRAKFETALKTLHEGKEFELTVTALPPFQSGYMNEAIFLKTNLPEMPLVTIRAQGYRPLAVTVTPKWVSLPSPMADGARKQILVRHTNGQSLKLTDLKITGEELKVSLEDAQPAGQAYWIIVSGPAGYELPRMGERITFKTDDVSTPQVTVPVIPSRRSPPVSQRPGARLATDAARSILRVASAFLRKGDPNSAEKWLRRVVDRYPESEAAKEASKLLDEMPRQAISGNSVHIVPAKQSGE